MEKIVYACDIGSTKPETNSFGWVRSDLATPFNPEGAGNIDVLLRHLSLDLKGGKSVALGFEAPLFMPVPSESRNLSSGRDNEGDRSMFAQAGGYVTTLACHQMAFILKEISNFQSKYKLTLDVKKWNKCKKPTILLWEAFVSGEGIHDANHVRDAATAANFFHSEQESLGEKSTVTTEHCFSVVGAVALWSGWLKKKSALRRKCLVLRPEQKYLGDWETLR